jgi:hypothetical protein
MGECVTIRECVRAVSHVLCAVYGCGNVRSFVLVRCAACSFRKIAAHFSHILGAYLARKSEKDKNKKRDILSFLFKIIKLSLSLSICLYID